MNGYYPPVGFHFGVAFDDLGADDLDLRFQHVSGLSVNVETTTLREGGENRFAHYLPTGVSYNELDLRRGLVVDSKLIDWCREAIEEFRFRPKDVLIHLLDETHVPRASWQVIHAYPVHWDVSEFDAEQSRVVVESLRLRYQYFKTLRI